MNHDESPDTELHGSHPSDPTRIDAPVPRAGGAFGPYVLRERIGEGGMGEVWKADQSAPIRRTVAIKLVKAGMDSREVLARFEVERQALALMDHPCIARVFDAGTTPQGRPYFAMEYVQGTPINEYCDKRRLGTRERLELFQKVCQGVQHAHQKAVIHRDLKPSNVLVADVDGEPSPKIIDFGVAKATTRKLTESTMYTSIGQMIGTPEYMSPEQAELTKEDIDTRTDVYSLGVILYELLVGALPFEPKELRQAGLEGMLRMLREEDPPKPSTRLSSLGERTSQVAQSRRTESKRLSSQLRGDLDWIVMRALEKDRNRRYGSPAELAQDLQRHLDDEPVLAGPPTVGYRMSKFVRRHRMGVAIATGAVVALGAFAVVTTVQAQAIARERDRATAEAAKAAAMNTFLTETLASADPWMGGDREATVVGALDAASEQIETTFAGQPEVEASLRAVLGRTYLALGKLDLARAQIERAVQMRIDRDGPDHRELAILRLTEVRLERQFADLAAAAVSAADAARIFRADPRTPLYDQVNAYQHEARSLFDLQRFAEAESVLVLSEELAPGLEGEQRMLSTENHALRADLRRYRDGDPAAADSLMRIAFELASSIDPDSPAVSTFLNNAAQFRSDRGDYEGALADFDSSLVLIARQFGTDHPLYASTLENRGGVHYRLGNVDQTFAALEQVYDIRLRNLGPDHIDVVRTRLNMGAVASIAGDYERAITIFRELKPVLIAVRGTDHPDVLAVLRNEGNALRSARRFDEAIEVLREGATIARRMHGEQHPQTAILHGDLAVAFEAAGRDAEAEREMLTAFDVYLATLGSDHPTTQHGARWLVRFFERTGRSDRAEQYRPHTGT